LVPKAWLRDVADSMRLSEAERTRLVWNERNGVALCVACHARHTSGFRKVPRSKVPLKVWPFIQEVNRLLGTEQASVRFEREYPDVG
jgi:hypothetical protein